VNGLVSLAMQADRIGWKGLLAEMVSMASEAACAPAPSEHPADTVALYLVPGAKLAAGLILCCPCRQWESDGCPDPGCGQLPHPLSSAPVDCPY
jgi:cation transport ATPase